MSLTLSNDLDVPAVVRTYLAAKLDGELDTILDCFTDDALVHDEGHDHLGRAAIRAWLSDLASRYTIDYRVLDANRWGETATLSVEVSGNFPGSPVVLHEHFGLLDGRIAALTICP